MTRTTTRLLRLERIMGRRTALLQRCRPELVSVKKA
jgi:hypothetical protein